MLLLFIIVLILFRHAFSIHFFIDDFFFLKIGKADTLGEMLAFFSPIKEYFYRPIPTELFYWFIHLTDNNRIIAHTVAFALYFAGLVYTYKSLAIVTKNKALAKLMIFMYAISFIHVFQLYQLATFIEVALFAFLAISFYYFLRKKLILSIVWFVCACMSKETAVLFPLFLVLFMIAFPLYRQSIRRIVPYLTVSIFFVLILKFGVSNVVETVDTYRIQYNLRLGLNNLMWYTLWSWGFPNFLPDYLVSIFRPPITEFWKVWRNDEIKIYFALLAIYLAGMAGAVLYVLVKLKKLYGRFALPVFATISFVLFISPTLLIFHKWMVRLTVPLVFVAVVQGYFIFLLLSKRGVVRYWGMSIVAVYCIFNIIAVRVHESSSTYLLETRIVNTADIYFYRHRESIVASKYIYFQDSKNPKLNYWGGSKKLKVTFHDQSFLDHYFPGTPLQAIYGYEHDTPPRGAYIVRSTDLLAPGL